MAANSAPISSSVLVLGGFSPASSTRCWKTSAVPWAHASTKELCQHHLRPLGAQFTAELLAFLGDIELRSLLGHSNHIGDGCRGTSCPLLLSIAEIMPAPSFEYFTVVICLFASEFSVVIGFSNCQLCSLFSEVIRCRIIIFGHLLLERRVRARSTHGVSLVFDCLFELRFPSGKESRSLSSMVDTWFKYGSIHRTACSAETMILLKKRKKRVPYSNVANSS